MSRRPRGLLCVCPQCMVSWGGYRPPSPRPVYHCGLPRSKEQAEGSLKDIENFQASGPGVGQSGWLAVFVSEVLSEHSRTHSSGVYRKSRPTPIEARRENLLNIYLFFHKIQSF